MPATFSMTPSAMVFFPPVVPVVVPVPVRPVDADVGLMLDMVSLSWGW
jgi:hypothetical protein